MYGSIRAKHLFMSNMWESGHLKSQYIGRRFGDSAFHTLVKVAQRGQLRLVKSPIYGLDLFDCGSGSGRESLVGIAYMKPDDVLPVCLYGYPYDLSLFA